MSRTVDRPLGVRASRRSREDVRVPSAVLQASASGATIGTAQLAIGAGIIGGAVTLWSGAVFALRVGDLERPEAAIAAWVVYLVMLTGGFVALSRIGARMPTWLAASMVGGLAVIVALDLWAVWPSGDIAGNITASFAATVTVLVFLSMRRIVEVVTVAAVAAVVFAIAVVATTPLSPETTPRQLVVLAAMLSAAPICMSIVRRFRRMVQLELDRVIVQSTVSAPRYAVGLLASEQLARLDLAAERLLESVAVGDAALPLDPESASTAASLATELRLHLLEGRRDTWLRHAITESELLGGAVTLHDPGGLAGLLDGRQRDALLATVWLVVADARAAAMGRTVDLSFGPATETVRTADGHRLVVPITLVVSGIARNQVDPSLWGELSAVGRHTHQLQRSTLTVPIECLVSNPRD